MKNTHLLPVALTLAALATSTFALSQPEDSRLGEGRVAHRVIARIETKLNITSDQRTQIKAILKTEEPTILALAAQAKEEREAITAIPRVQRGRGSRGDPTVRSHQHRHRRLSVPRYGWSCGRS